MTRLTRLVFLLALVMMGWAIAPNATGDIQAWAPGAMPVNLAARMVAAPDYATAKKATLRIETDKSVCSATAIDDGGEPGTHVVLTAAHCVEIGRLNDLFGIHVPDLAHMQYLTLNGRKARVVKYEFDKYDSVKLTVDLWFEHFASFGPKPKQGDITFSHGNPDGTPDMLLVGLVAGWTSEYQGVPDVMLLDRNDFYGSSGAGVFDASGRIVGVVNAVFPWPQRGWRLIAVYPQTFDTLPMTVCDAPLERDGSQRSAKCTLTPESNQ